MRPCINKSTRRCGRTAKRHHPVKAMIAFQPIRQIFDGLATDGEFAYEGDVPVIQDRAYLTLPAADLDRHVQAERIRVELEDTGALGAQS